MSFKYIISFCFTVVTLTLSSFAFAACTNQIPSIPVQAGGASVHVTVNDQNCVSIPPANLSFTPAGGFIGILDVTPDSTGFNLSVPNVNQSALNGIVNFKNTANNVNANLTVNITPGGVTSLSFASP